MEIDPNDHPAEKELKLSVVDVYNRCVYWFNEGRLEGGR